MNAKETLKQMQLDEFKRKYPNVPSYAIPKTKAKKSGANQLQSDIESFCKLNGQFCEPVHTKGTYRKDKGIFTSGNYIKGSADLHIMLWHTYRGLIVWKCEVKWNKDVQSEDQKKYQQLIEEFNKKATTPTHRVLYSIVKTFDDFTNQYFELIRY